MRLRELRLCPWTITGRIGKQQSSGPLAVPTKGANFSCISQSPHRASFTTKSRGQMLIVSLSFSSYPMSPPIVRFLTKIIHPNVSRHGDVGIDIIQHNWSLALTISKLLLSVQSLLTDPFTEVGS